MNIDKTFIVNRVLSSPFAKEIILMHGASMVMHDVKENTADIDCQLDLERWSNIDIESQTCTDGVIRFHYEVFDFGDGKLRDVDHIVIDGIKCQTLDSIIEDKLRLAREKDLLAINEIRKFKQHH